MTEPKNRDYERLIHCVATVELKKRVAAEAKRRGMSSSRFVAAILESVIPRFEKQKTVVVGLEIPE